MRIIETTVYTIDEHPNKEACYRWIRDNWHDLSEHSVYEVAQSIKALSAKIGGEYDYSISASPDRGELVSFSGYDQEELDKLNADDLPLTGVCWDAVLIEGLKEGNPEKVLKALHDDTEYRYSDEGLYEFCEANEYEFNELGQFVG